MYSRERRYVLSEKIMQDASKRLKDSFKEAARLESDSSSYFIMQISLSLSLPYFSTLRFLILPLLLPFYLLPNGLSITLSASISRTHTLSIYLSISLFLYTLSHPYYSSPVFKPFQHQYIIFLT